MYIFIFQTRFIKPYMDICTAKRKGAASKAMSNVYKLLANSVYGKLIESSSKRMDCKFARSGELAQKHASSPLFKGFNICSEDVTISFHKKKSISVKQPSLVGFAVLEISKLIMQRLYYKEIRPKMQDQVQVLMSDTDSFLMLVEMKSSTEAVRALRDVMDCSNYKEDHVLFDNTRKFQLGYLKNEIPCSEILRFVGLRAKTYVFETSSNETHSRAKGVGQVAKRKIRLIDFLSCLQRIRQFVTKQKSIQCKNHVARLVEAEKVAFSSFDDKRYLLCSIHSVPYGSVLIEYSKRLFNNCYFCAYPEVLA